MFIETRLQSYEKASYDIKKAQKNAYAVHEMLTRNQKEVGDENRKQKPCEAVIIRINLVSRDSRVISYHDNGSGTSFHSEKNAFIVHKILDSHRNQPEDPRACC